MLKAGLAECIISPPEGVMLGGYARGDRHNRGVHDDLHATALYLTQNDLRFLLISLDILTVAASAVEAARRRISAASGIPEKAILLCCSHTHSGPAPGNAAYDAWLADRLTALAAEALSHPFPAAIGTASGHCGAEEGVGGNRFTRGGTADPTVGVLAIRDDTGDLRLVLANYALHPTVLHEDNVLVSADYPGAIRQTIQSAYPGCLFGFLQGASGNQSTRYFRRNQGYDEVTRIGQALGAAVLSALSAMDFSEPMLSLDFASSPIFLRELPPEDQIRAEIAEKNALEQRLIAEQAPYADIQDAHNQAIGAECMLRNLSAIRKLRAELTPETDHCPLTALRIGSALILFSKGELFLEFALQMRAASHALRTFIVTLTNGYLPGYVYTREAIPIGGYEVSSSMLAPETGEALAAAGAALADRVTR